MALVAAAGFDGFVVTLDEAVARADAADDRVDRSGADAREGYRCRFCRAQGVSGVGERSFFGDPGGHLLEISEAKPPD